jgi:hypothetical protein
MSATMRKRPVSDESQERNIRKRRLSNKGVNVFIPVNLTPVNLHASVSADLGEEASSSTEEPTYTQSEVCALLTNQEQAFRLILEEKLREQFNLFNQLYIDNIFREYESSYIN